MSDQTNLDQIEMKRQEIVSEIMSTLVDHETEIGDFEDSVGYLASTITALFLFVKETQNYEPTFEELKVMVTDKMSEELERMSKKFLTRRN